MKLFEKLKERFIYDHVAQNKDILSKIHTEDFLNIDQVLKTICKNGICPRENNIIIGENLYDDVEIFKNYHGDTSSTVLSTFTPNLQGSTHYLKMILANPLTNINILQKRQKTLESIQVTEDINILFKELKELEKDVLWIFLEKDDNLRDLFDIVYFKWRILHGLNESSGVLTANVLYKSLLSPIMGVISPIIYFIVPYLVLRMKFKMNVSFVSYLKILFESLTSNETMVIFGISGNYAWLKHLSNLMSLVFYFQGIFNSVELAKTFYKISKHITNKINNVARFVQVSRQLIEKLWTPDIDCFFKDRHNINIQGFDFNPRPFSLLSNFGRQLREFKKLDRNTLLEFTNNIYIIDAIYTIKKYKENFKGCYAIYTNDLPTIQANNIWHPCLDPNKIVKNNINIGAHNNAIITGPNAGGKSTFIKSILINIIFAQTIGVCTAEGFTLTPLEIINSQINIPDNKGHESLFEAEMYRCKKNLDLLASNSKAKTLIVLDEIFSSTNPIEGISGAYAIAKKMASFNNCILIFTTHFTYLTKLAKDTHLFTNYRMNIIYNDNNNIEYPYKLEKGISKQYIALELLKKNGFPADIINEAIEMKTKFLT